MATAVATLQQNSMKWLVQQLESGPLEVLALTVLSSLVTVPITQYRPLYGFSVGYGLSVAVIGTFLWFMVLKSPPSPLDASRVLVASAMLYGFRLATYLLLRDLRGWKPQGESKGMGRWIRVPFAVSLSFLYGCMTSPVVHAIRRPPPASNRAGRAVALGGAYAAVAAAILQAIADAHKAACKNRRPSPPPSSSAAKGGVFAGPSSGLYSMTRHPNYTAEVLFWTALYVAGMPSYGTAVVPWLESTFGWYCIVNRQHHD